jgi:hypothetical protein
MIAGKHKRNFVRVALLVLVFLVLPLSAKSIVDQAAVRPVAGAVVADSTPAPTPTQSTSAAAQSEKLKEAEAQIFRMVKSGQMTAAQGRAALTMIKASMASQQSAASGVVEGTALTPEQTLAQFRKSLDQAIQLHTMTRAQADAAYSANKEGLAKQQTQSGPPPPAEVVDPNLPWPHGSTGSIDLNNGETINISWDYVDKSSQDQNWNRRLNDYLHISLPHFESDGGSLVPKCYVTGTAGGYLGYDDTGTYLSDCDGHTWRWNAKTRKVTLILLSSTNKGLPADLDTRLSPNSI